MRKILATLLFIFIISPSFAQSGISKQVQAAIQRAGTGADEAVTRAIINIITDRVLLSQQIATMALVPLNMPKSGTTQPVLAFPKNSPRLPRELKAAGALAPSPESMSEVNADLSLYFLLRGKHRSMYRGMGLSNLEEVRDILLDGLKVEKTNYPDIYMTQFPTLALEFATHYNPDKISVIVIISAEAIFPFIEPVASDEYTCNRDVTTDMIDEVLVFLNINGKEAWHRAVLQDDHLVFLPLPEEPMDEIENLPEEMY
ncbi:MAG: hypothetical protein IKP96_05760 [Elusimicrobiaceae bacterium]|nr:hypothetical protein [Elusimicrobiaceae bacterium]